MPEITSIYCATANPLEVIIMETEQGRAILGIVERLDLEGLRKRKTQRSENSFSSALDELGSILIPNL